MACLGQGSLQHEPDLAAWHNAGSAVGSAGLKMHLISPFSVKHEARHLVNNPAGSLARAVQRILARCGQRGHYTVHSAWRQGWVIPERLGRAGMSWAVLLAASTSHGSLAECGQLGHYIVNGAGRECQGIPRQMERVAMSWAFSHSGQGIGASEFSQHGNSIFAREGHSSPAHCGQRGGKKSAAICFKPSRVLLAMLRAVNKQSSVPHLFVYYTVRGRILSELNSALS